MSSQIIIFTYPIFPKPLWPKGWYTKYTPMDENTKFSIIIPSWQWSWVQWIPVGAVLFGHVIWILLIESLFWWISLHNWNFACFIWALGNSFRILFVIDSKANSHHTEVEHCCPQSQFESSHFFNCSLITKQISKRIIVIMNWRKQYGTAWCLLAYINKWNYLIRNWCINKYCDWCFDGLWEI